MSGDLIDVLIPVPLLENFTYKVPKEYKNKKLEKGLRLKVPFGNRTVTGIFWTYSDPVSYTHLTLPTNREV